jgi:hypothetical protein
MTTITVRPITDSDRRPVAEFLHAHLSDRIPADAWARYLVVPWKVDAPNHGFQLLDGNAVVGVYLAFYSERTIDGRPERFCNLGAWCVRPEYRFAGIRLLKALLAQDGYHFTDLSPSGNVVPLNSRLNFRFLDTTTALVPNLPWPSWPRRQAISSDPAVIEATLTGPELGLYRDHVGAEAARHLVLTRGGESCYVIFRKDRRKNLPLFASILYVSNPDLFRAMARRVARHLLLRHGVAATLAELRVIGHRPRFSVLLRTPRRKMFKSPRLAPDQVDYLYSELVCVAW